MGMVHLHTQGAGTSLRGSNGDELDRREKQDKT
jgi:hypothetical protein